MIFVVTNRKLVTNGDLLRKVEQIAAGGADAIILREKDLEYDELLTLAKGVKARINGYKTRLIINQSLDVAREVGASGVHMSFNPFVIAKTSFEGLVGVSVHSLEEAIEAEALGANYLLVGHIYSTDCKKGMEPRGIEFLKKIISSTNIPIIAIGGIDGNNCSEVLSTGAHGIAVMSSIMKSENCYEKIEELKYNITINTLKYHI